MWFRDTPVLESRGPSDSRLEEWESPQAAKNKASLASQVKKYPSWLTGRTWELSVWGLQNDNSFHHNQLLVDLLELDQPLELGGACLWYPSLHLSLQRVSVASGLLVPHFLLFSVFRPKNTIFLFYLNLHLSFKTQLNTYY